MASPYLFIMARALHLWGWRWIVQDLVLQWDELFRRKAVRRPALKAVS